MILNHDVRIRHHVIGTMAAHEQEVCGLKWSASGQQLASGGNDNMLHIWDAAAASSASASPIHRLDEHQAAVKASAWCPFQSNLLASGGGIADRCIKFWNTNTGACVNSIHTQSQACALQWSKHEKEILSSDGFNQNQLFLWKYPFMVKMAKFTGHALLWSASLWNNHQSQVLIRVHLTAPFIILSKTLLQPLSFTTF